MGVVQAVHRGNVCLTCLEQGLQGGILQSREVQALIGIEIHGLGNDTILHRFQILGALGHNHDVGTVLTA